MNKSSAELKQLAKGRLSGRYGVPMGATLIVYAASFLMILVTESIFLGNNIYNPFSLITFYLISFITSLLLSILTVGLTNLILTFIRKGEAPLSCLIYGFTHHPDKFIITYIILMLIMVAASIPLTATLIVFIASDYSTIAFVLMLLAIIASMVLIMIFALRYSMALYILNDNPEKGCIEALKQSSQMMKGNKGRLFYLTFSFLGWIILGTCSCYIGFLWIAPYISTTMAYFYLDLKGELTQAESESNVYKDAFRNEYNSRNPYSGVSSVQDFAPYGSNIPDSSHVPSPSLPQNKQEPERQKEQQALQDPPASQTPQIPQEQQLSETPQSAQGLQTPKPELSAAAENGVSKSIDSNAEFNNTLEIKENEGTGQKPAISREGNNYVKEDPEYYNSYKSADMAADDTDPKDTGHPL